MTDAISSDAIAENHRYWQDCKDTFLAGGDYYQHVKAILPLLCELHLDKSSRVLDVGCGNGEFSAVIAEHCGRLEGFDLSESLVAHAQSLKVPNATFSCRGVNDLIAVPERSYDAIFVMGVFATLHGEVFQETVHQLERCLKIGGLIVARDTLSVNADIVRRVNSGYTAHYRSVNHYLEVFNRQGLKLVRSVFLANWTETQNFFLIFARSQG